MLKDFKPVLGILLRFIIIYVVFIFAYQFYLNHFQAKGLDPYSRMVADQAAFLQNSFGYKTFLYNDVPNEQIWFHVKGEYITRMVEGCNAVSVIILFVAFIFAFYKGVQTFVFALAGFAVLYVMNVSRIVGLNIVVRDFPQYSKTGHDYVFPAVIYGSVVVLWLVWIKFFALKK
ncbi:exosortase XrtF [Chryseobacterium sp. Leaf404]|uniref:exosortase family protein XrtF n=1 Tax=unclassified Chryseobacterium TaxID=2593645 RepID=UPI00070128AF|nr:MULTISPECIES: exosortase family protein XrtF [unclassified Chryseobacterium]KQT15562.1 exosortase XrtF [Chryseobacterium sp. Leaf404]